MATPGEKEAAKKRRLVKHKSKLAYMLRFSSFYSEAQIRKEKEIVAQLEQNIQSNPGNVLKKLRKGITGRIKLVRGKLIIKT